MQSTAILSKRGFRRAAFCIPALALLAALTAMIAAPAPCQADASLIIKTGNTWSVTGKDDLQQLKYLASGVGWEFAPTGDTTAALKAVGIKTIRCINVEPSDGTFDKDGNFTLTQLNVRLQAHLDTCTTLGAVPHIIIGTSFPDALRLKPEDVPDQYKQDVRDHFYGPTDWTKFRNYYLALFEYILITKGFSNAEFEVANEPDINGGIYPAPPRPSSGARANYEAAFNLYKNIAQAAVAFEVKHPGMHVTLGGPAASWAFTFKFGDFNWIEHFIRDCAEQKLKLDFVGVHFYGNICSLDGQYDALYPPFTDMWRTTQAAIDTYYPGIPLEVTEWGPSYVTNTSEEAAVNANNVGVAWGADFLNTMLGCGISKALYLVTTDYNQPANGKPVDTGARALLRRTLQPA